MLNKIRKIGILIFSVVLCMNIGINTSAMRNHSCFEDRCTFDWVIKNMNNKNDELKKGCERSDKLLKLVDEIEKIISKFENNFVYFREKCDELQ